MSFWSKKAPLEPEHRGVARAIIAAAPREEWMRQAVHAISESFTIDRVGIWLEPELAIERAHDVFRGMVWDRDSLDVPSEWLHLSPEAPLPQEVQHVVEVL